MKQKIIKGKTIEAKRVKVRQTDIVKETSASIVKNESFHSDVSSVDVGRGYIS